MCNWLSPVADYSMEPERRLLDIVNSKMGGSYSKEDHESPEEEVDYLRKVVIPSFSFQENWTMADGGFSLDPGGGFDPSKYDFLETEAKLENPSPTANHKFSFSRTSSTGSIHAISHSSASSAQNTDDEDSDGKHSHVSYKDRRREAHTQAEQKRRDAIKKGYDELQSLVPTCQTQETLGTQKLSKATILQKSIDYIQYLLQKKKEQEADLDALRKDVMALKIMKANYEHIVKAHQNTPQAGQNQVSDELKFQVFQQIMDNLFTSFNASVSVANFAELSGCVFSWLEEFCKPKKGYDELQSLVPTCQTQETLGTQKLSKATILQKSIDYIQYLLQKKKEQEADLDALRKDVMALKIMKANYEHIVKAHQNTPQAGQNQVSDELKFQVFQQIMDNLFTSFNASVSVANFAELSGCVFSWLEEFCKPKTLRELAMNMLTQLNSHING